MRLHPDNPIAGAVTRAQRSFRGKDAAGCDQAYRQAVSLAGGDPRLRSELAADHVGRILELGCPDRALQRCDTYLNEAEAGNPYLRILRAEALSALGDHDNAATEAAALLTESAGLDLAPEGIARMHRVLGLTAIDRGGRTAAQLHLDRARSLFEEMRQQNGVIYLDNDFRLIDVMEGAETALASVLDGERPQTVADHLLLATAFKRRSRYEEAYRVLLDCTERFDLEGRRWPVLREMVVLLRALRQPAAAERLRPSLEEAAAHSFDPRTAMAQVAGLFEVKVPDAPVPRRFDGKIQHARRLIEARKYEDAEHLLIELRDRACTDREIALWHLATGELEVIRSQFSLDRPSLVEDAVGHLAQAFFHASATWLVEIRITALRLLGRVFAERFTSADTDDRAAMCWAEAHRLEERIAGRQPSDEVRVRMLQAVPNEHDERVRAAVEAVAKHGDEATASIVVAMEGARGAMILDRILPTEAGPVRSLPRPSDLNGAWRWMRGIADRLPRSQAVWLVHAAPHHVHHVVIGRGFVFHRSAACARQGLSEAIDRLALCWSNENFLEHSVRGGIFDDCLRELAKRISLHKVIPDLPPHVRRLAIVAGAELSDVPFAALTVPGDKSPLGIRLALSDLPCLSARLPLHRRSLPARGDRWLRVRPGGAGLAPPPDVPDLDSLDGPWATRENLRERLAMGRHRCARIDSHGEYGHADAADSVLMLAPAGPAGHLRPQELQEMDLRGCGTLVLGACESGMAQRIGRDERSGFVRAAFRAGAASVIAARWKAPAAVAAPLLDRFEQYARQLPRDLALQRAQRDLYEGALDVQAKLDAVRNPARWACWTLYGDSGWQTKAGPVRRGLRRLRVERPR